MSDTLKIGTKEFTSRFLLGTGKFSLEKTAEAVNAADAQIVTMALRRAKEAGSSNILEYIPDTVTLLPNTSGARNAREAVRIARLAREVGCGDFIKIEVIRDTKYLMPDNAETIKATEILADEGFTVLPYVTPDLNTARDLENAGAAAVMPLAAPIGSNKGLLTKEFIQMLIDDIDLPVIVDAESGNRPRPVRQWRWEPMRSWQTRRWQQQKMSYPWQRLLKWQWMPEERHTLRGWDVFFIREEIIISADRIFGGLGRWRY